MFIRTKFASEEAKKKKLGCGETGGGTWVVGETAVIWNGNIDARWTERAQCRPQVAMAFL